jgi:hypothetical protein
MMVQYLIRDYVGTYSKKLYLPAGSEVYIIQRSDNMCLVYDKSDNKHWIPQNYLTQNLADVLPTMPRPPIRKGRSSK